MADRWERHRRAATDAFLADLRALAPKQNRYALGAEPSAGKLAPGWRVILPEALIDRGFQGQ